MCFKLHPFRARGNCPPVHTQDEVRCKWQAQNIWTSRLMGMTLTWILQRYAKCENVWKWGEGFRLNVQVFSAETVKLTGFLNVMQRAMIEYHTHFCRICWHHFQGGRLKRVRVVASEISVNFYHYIRRPISEHTRKAEMKTKFWVFTGKTKSNPRR